MLLTLFFMTGLKNDRLGEFCESMFGVPRPRSARLRRHCQKGPPQAGDPHKDSKVTPILNVLDSYEEEEEFRSFAAALPHDSEAARKLVQVRSVRPQFPR